MIKRLKYFHDGLNIVVALAPGCEFFSAKWGITYRFLYSFCHNDAKNMGFSHHAIYVIPKLLAKLIVFKNLKKKKMNVPRIKKEKLHL